MGMIPIFDDPHAISLTPNPELVSEMARSGYQNTPDLYQIMTMHMHEQAPSTKGPEPHNRPLPQPERVRLVRAASGSAGGQHQAERLHNGHSREGCPWPRCLPSSARGASNIS